MDKRITKKFKLCRYFDTYPDGVNGIFEEEERAKMTKKNLEKKASPHTKYRIEPVYFLDGKEIKESVLQNLIIRQDNTGE